MDNEYYKRYEPFFGSWHIKRFIGAGSYGKVFEIERRDFDMVFTGALKAITINPAKHIGIADRVGSIEVGKDADLVLTDGCPFEVMTNVKAVLINGAVVSQK